MQAIRKDLRVYVDNSVINAPFDKSGDHAAQTKPFWDAVINGNVRIIVSDVLVEEMRGAPPEVRVFFGSLPRSQVEVIAATEESDSLAAKYVSAGIVTDKHWTDCRHIALATICKADFLVRWNCKHMVNVFKKRGYTAVNMLTGYQTIEIQTPNEVINDEDTF